MRFKSPTRGLPFHPLERSGALHPDRAALASAAWKETLFAARIAPVHPIPGLETDLLRAAPCDLQPHLHRHARIDLLAGIGSVIAADRTRVVWGKVLLVREVFS